MKSNTFLDAVAGVFQKKPNQWVNADELMAVGGKYAFRTRVSDARRVYNMKIDNRVTRTKGGIAKSEYRFIPEHAGEQSGRLF